MQATVRKHILNLWSLQGNTPFSMNGKTMVIHERSKFETFVAVIYKMIQIFHYPHLLPWLQQNCPVHHFFWSMGEASTSFWLPTSSVFYLCTR